MKNNRGFTLIELMVTLAVIIVLLVVGVPNLKSFMQSNRLTSSTNLLVISLNLARSEAVKRGTVIKTCVNNTAQNDCNNVVNWEHGWITFIDTDNDDTIDGGETVLRVNEALGGGTTIRSGQFTNIISYNSDGSANTNGSFKVCDKDANLIKAKGINVAPTGIIGQARDLDTTPDKKVNIYTSGTTFGNITCP